MIWPAMPEGLSDDRRVRGAPAAGQVVDRRRGADVRDELVRLALLGLRVRRPAGVATIRLARRLSRSTLIGGLAGLLLTLDGLAFVMCRTALLDIFQAVFVVAAVACCVADRDWYRERLADQLAQRGLPDFAGEFGPVVWLRPWRTAAGVCSVPRWDASGTRSSCWPRSRCSAWLWDVGARRLAGADWRSWLALLLDGVPAFVRLVVVSLLVYLSTWTGWLSELRRLQRAVGPRRTPGASLGQRLRRAVRLAVGVPQGDLRVPHRRLHQQRHSPLRRSSGRLAGDAAAHRFRRGERHHARNRRLCRPGQLHPGDRHRHARPCGGSPCSR